MLDLTRAAGNESGNETKPANSPVSKASSQVNRNASPFNAHPVLKITGHISSSVDDQPKSKQTSAEKSEKAISPSKRRSSICKNILDTNEMSPEKSKESATSLSDSSPSSVFPSVSVDTEGEIVTSVSNTSKKEKSKKKEKK